MPMSRCAVGRCLETFTTVTAPFDEIFLQTYDVTSGLPLHARTKRMPTLH